MAFDKLNNDFESAFCAVVERLQPLGIKNLSKEQKSSLKSFCKGQDTLAVLPTGHGKSLIFQMAVLMAREMKRDQLIVVLISPLKSLIADQIRECERYDLSSIKLEESSIAFILQKECKCQDIRVICCKIATHVFMPAINWNRC
jgi:superfamily II DNA helicase RecQ